MGGKNPEALDDLEQVLFTNPVVAGEAGYAVGLILLGTANTASADEMLIYAQKPNMRKSFVGWLLVLGLFTMSVRKQQTRYFLLRRFVDLYLFNRNSLIISP
jgi:26S proteasome regulatory subunit N2